MDYITLMDRLFNNNDLKIEDLKKGLTNRNFLLQLDGEKFVLRTPHFDNEQIVIRHHETLALEAIKDCDIDVETIFYDEPSGYKVTRFIEDAQDFNEYKGENSIARVAQLMKRFHSLQKHIHVDFDPIQRYKNYKTILKDPLFDITTYESILLDVSSLSYDKVLCHNDWVEGNILFTKDKTYLIDFEYAADNDPIFDVMSFLSENNIVDEQQRAIFYNIYFDEITPNKQHRLQVWECFHNLLWCTWAMMMYEQRHDDIYKQIATMKYEALCNAFTTYKKKEN